MVLQRWAPFNELRQMQNTMNRLWQGIAVPLDVLQEGDNFVIRMTSMSLSKITC